MSKFRVVFMACLISSSLFLPTSLNTAEAIDPSQSKLEGTTLYVKLPSSISIFDYKQYHANKLEKNRADEVWRILYTLSSDFLKFYGNSESELTVSFTDNDFNIIDFSEPINMTVEEIGPPETNALTFDFLTEDRCGETCVGWTPEEIATLENSYQEALPIMKEVFGPPFGNVTFKVIHDPDLAAAGFTSDSTKTISLNSPISSEEAIEKQTFWHEWTHANSTGSRFFTNNDTKDWAESLAQFQKTVIEKATNTSPLTNHLPLATQNYEQFNNPRFDSIMIGYHDTDPVNYSSVYTTGGNFWLKLYRQYPGIIKVFNNALYNHQLLGREMDPTKRYYLFKDVLALLNDYISSSKTGTIEGMNFYDWFANQYSLYKSKGDELFGARLSSHLINEGGVNYEKILLGMNYTKSSSIQNRQSTDINLDGQVHYELKDYENNLITSADLAINGRDSIDLTETVKSYFGGSVPNERICVVASLVSPTPSTDESCYYLKGDKLTEDQIGIVGTVGESADQIPGIVTIKWKGDGEISETVDIVNGGFLATGPNNAFYEKGGLFEIEVNIGSEIIKKSFVKDIKSYYFVPFFRNSELKLVNSLTSTPITSYTSTIRANTDEAINYFGSEGPDKAPYFIGRTFDISKNQSYALTPTVAGFDYPKLAVGHKYFLYTLNDQKQGTFGSQFDFGTTPDIYFAKWSDVSTAKSGDEIKYSIKAKNLTTSSLTGVNIADNLVGINYVANSATLNNSSVTDISDEDAFTIDGNNLSWAIPSLNTEDSVLVAFKSSVP